MTHSLARLLKLLAYPLAGALILGAATSVYAQSRTGAVSPATQKRQTDASIATGRAAISRSAPVTASAAPIGLALENSPAPASTPEPITLALVGGALAGLYGMRRHLS